MKVILHLDLDSYFVSAHRTIDKSTIGHPTVVTSGKKRSIITACSYEAKYLGIHTGMPLYKALNIRPNLKMIKPDFSLYVSLSQKIFDLITNEYTGKIEIGSIDECYIDATDIWKKYGSPLNLAKEIQENILKKLSLPSSIGISNNKFVAKMASPLEKPYGIKVLKAEDFLDFFKDKKIEKIHGIGSPTAKKLNDIGIFLIGELSNSNLNIIENILGKRAKEIYDKSLGIGSDEIDTSLNDLKSIGNSITFLQNDKTGRRYILETLKELCLLVSKRMENRNMCGKVIRVAIKYSDDNKPRSKQIKLSRYIWKFEKIYQEAVELFDVIWNHEPLKFLSFTITDLENIFEVKEQLSLFDKNKSSNNIGDIVKSVNTKMKTKAIYKGNEFEAVLNKNKKQSKYLENDKEIWKEVKRH